MGGVVVLVLASGALAAVAGGKPAASATGDGAAGTVAELTLTSGDALAMPAVTSFALVALASLGVVLVTRGRVRRGVAVLGLLAALGSAAAVVQAWWGVRSTIRDTLASVGADGGVATSGWYLVAAASSVVLVLATAAVVRLVPTWPEMGSRYDAPTGAAARPTRTPLDEGASSMDLWKALDEGEDPTSEADAAPGTPARGSEGSDRLD
ncbi:Trp biosynthesis-associated membrane protein [Nocardioides bruguierae]|uniref:Trp biosynthesis-associated membrane protein n=1 Tax=Nocardioides bruguierae TaxID=2945102 RepID=UPI002020A461|nr:Trp biosynthesis-associated membrane protein [Nocardioides bruguierae]MCL8027562.1 Trp biosynthesis-associated membrane protein [Nocardioides bruguierae]